MSKEQADALNRIADNLYSPNCSDGNFEAANICDGLYQVAGSIRFAAKHLGTEDAATPMGAIEAFSVAVREGACAISGSIDRLAEAIENHPS